MRLLLVSSIVGTLLALQVPSPKVAFPGGEVEALGVCDVRPDAVSCWNMQGAPAVDLETSVRAALGNNEVSFRLGKKNRLLVTQRPQRLQVNYRADGNDYLYSNYSRSGEPMMEFLRYAAEPSATSVTLHLQTTVQSDKDFDVPFRKGGVAQIEGDQLEIGDSVKILAGKDALPDPSNGYDGTQAADTDYWNVVLGVKREGEGYVQWAYTPLDSAGEAIRYVDAQGRPISALKALALEPNLPSANGYNGRRNFARTAGKAKPKAAVAYFQGTGPAPAFRATTNIDPGSIATLRIRPSHMQTADLGPFPLDPK